MTTRIIAEAFLVFWSFTHSPVLAFFVLMTFLYTHIDRNELLSQIQALNEITMNTEDKKKEIDQKALQKIKSMNPQSRRFEIYKECVITDYQFYFEIMDPVGNMLEQLYSSMEEAKADIDTMEPYLPKPKRSRSRIHNIRFVR
jgi:hypothetical protein